MSTSIMNTYGQKNLQFSQGEGVWLMDDAGRRYLDGISGIGVNSLGHAHPNTTAVINEQACKLLHTSNLYHITNQQALAEKLTEITGLANCFFSNSGAEANEAAIKLARKYGANKGIEKPTVITFTGAFHGRTIATLTATGNEKLKDGFGPFPEGFIQCQYNDLASVEAQSSNTDIVAVLIETIQGEGGVNPANDEFLNGLRELCTANDWLLMLDEVQTGNGRTGHYFSYQAYDWQPDVLTTAKGLGNGLPIGACIASDKVADVLQPGSHGSTYGGNPLVTAVALNTINTILNNNLLANVQAMGNKLKNQLSDALKDHPQVVDIRGKGLMIGVELTKPCSDFIGRAIEKGVLICLSRDKVIRFLPPLIINEEEIDLLARTIITLIDGLGKES
ncbi:MAG: aspartate aminotransferase family protein [Cellvibrionales bacterium]|nr:aspartate aminotransferase family protein [Cellvibrionales bacterium]